MTVRWDHRWNFPLQAAQPASERTESAAERTVDVLPAPMVDTTIEKEAKAEGSATRAGERFESGQQQ